MNFIKRLASLDMTKEEVNTLQSLQAKGYAICVIEVPKGVNAQELERIMSEAAHEHIYYQEQR